ncbi:hypothetical protein F0562_022102 [Nyssa sinensis]|uniref:Uncharacterized protein n=1 Tax=Nyssa sinensis TaxID=561372 RepID=A0A5J5BRB5_9ASTE|nr:hypothetical protein F0562_022102 [Nyssa sinensis]
MVMKFVQEGHWNPMVDQTENAPIFTGLTQLVMVYALQADYRKRVRIWVLFGGHVWFNAMDAGAKPPSRVCFRHFNFHSSEGTGISSHSAHLRRSRSLNLIPSVRPQSSWPSLTISPLTLSIHLRLSQPRLQASSESKNLLQASMAKHHPDLIMCRKQPGIAIGRLCEKCDGKCVIC